MKKESALATMLYRRADKLSGTARQRAIRKADEFIRAIQVKEKKRVSPMSKKRGGLIKK